jgi:hypothetical protein
MQYAWLGLVLIMATVSALTIKEKGNDNTTNSFCFSKHFFTLPKCRF